jgi:hypothetical protein
MRIDAFGTDYWYAAIKIGGGANELVVYGHGPSGDWFGLAIGPAGNITYAAIAQPTPTGRDVTLGAEFASGSPTIVTIVDDVRTTQTVANMDVPDTSGTLSLGYTDSPTLDARMYWAQLERLDANGDVTELVWRFDANEYPGTGMSYVDPRGRTWTLTNAAAIKPKRSPLVWRFDANDYPGTGTTYVDPRGRTWTLSAAGAIAGP